jgi:hypothetical protein
MYKKIFYAFCIAAITMSCGSGDKGKQISASDVELNEPKEKKSIRLMWLIRRT